MVTKSLWLPLSVVGLTSPPAESRFLRGANSTVCLSMRQCLAKFQSLDTGGTFSADRSFPTKGCFSKNSNVFFGMGGTYAEKAVANLPGNITRIWCDEETVEVEEPTLSVVIPVTPVTKVPTSIPSGIRKRPTPTPTLVFSAQSTSLKPTAPPQPTGIEWNHGSSLATSDGVGTIKLVVPSLAEIGDTLFMFFR